MHTLDSITQQRQSTVKLYKSSFEIARSCSRLGLWWKKSKTTCIANFRKNLWQTIVQLDPHFGILNAIGKGKIWTEAKSGLFYLGSKTWGSLDSALHLFDGSERMQRRESKPFRGHLRHTVMMISSSLDTIKADKSCQVQSSKQMSGISKKVFLRIFMPNCRYRPGFWWLMHKLLLHLQSLWQSLCFEIAAKIPYKIQ